MRRGDAGPPRLTGRAESGRMVASGLAHLALAWSRKRRKVMVNPADTLPARVRSVRLRHVDELSELVHDIFDPRKRERISNRAVQTLLDDMAERAALEGKSACRVWEDVWQEIA